MGNHQTIESRLRADDDHTEEGYAILVQHNDALLQVSTDEVYVQKKEPIDGDSPR
jgi:hypothetical protein